MSLVFMPRTSNVDAHDIAMAVSRLSVVGYSIPEEDEDDEEEDGQDRLSNHENDKDAEDSLAHGTETDMIRQPLRKSISKTASLRKKSKSKSKAAIILDKIISFYDESGLKHVSPILLLILYSLIGAGLFCVIEKPNEVQQSKTKQEKHDKAREITLRELEWIFSNGTLSEETKLFATRDLMLKYEQELGLQTQPVMQWDMWGALFYVGTVYTTIGYGNIYCSTAGGRVLTIIYAIFGIPLVLAILSDLGTLFCKWINKIWKLMKYYIGGRTKKIISKRKSNGVDVEASGETGKGSANDTANEAAKKPEIVEKTVEEDFQEVPVSLAIAFTLLWLFFCSSLFMCWETDWSYFQSVYFFFISLSTIGLGDIVPSRPRLMVMNFGLVIVGLSLVSMTISVIQQNIESFLYKVLKMIKEEYQAAIEAGMELDQDEVVDKVLGKQPWYVKKLAPYIMTNNQQKQFAEIISFNQPLMVNTGTQFETLEKPMLVSASVQTFRPVAEIFTQTEEAEFETEDEAIGGDDFAELAKSYVDTAVQTAVDVMPSVLLRTEYDSTPLFSMQCTSTRDEGVQVECTTPVIATMPIKEASMEKNYEDVSVQTMDSYLKLAKKLEALKVNRAKSLAIWSSPVVKRPRPTPILESTPE